MIGLLGTAVTASFFDSLNPSAIAQQMLIQAMLKKKRHVWFFILGIGLANIVLGIGIYYGVVAWISELLSNLASNYPLYTYGAETAAGILLLSLGAFLIFRTRRINASAESAENTAKAPKSLSPVSLFIMGAAFCGVELTSALPYFGFLAILASYELVFPFVLSFIILYTFIYALPLILLYFGYNKIQGTKAIKKLEFVMGKVASYIVPVVIFLVGAYMIYSGMIALI